MTNKPWLIAVAEGGAVIHKEPVSSVDDAKSKFDKLKKKESFLYDGHIAFRDKDKNEEIVWHDPASGESDLVSIFNAFGEKSKYATYAEFCKASGTDPSLVMVDAEEPDELEPETESEAT